MNWRACAFPTAGLAAGLDKNARCIDALASMGFGFVEVGTVTPKAQPGNPKPRMFRLPQAQALINRLGFNNDGLTPLANVQRLHLRQRQRKDRPMLLGLNIGKNAATPIERATDDYLILPGRRLPHADYVTVNISSPNTKNLRACKATPRSTACWKRHCRAAPPSNWRSSTPAPTARSAMPFREIAPRPG